MLDIDDIMHVDSVIAREFPLHNCSSWNRIKKELVVVQKPAHNTGSPKLLDRLSMLLKPVRFPSEKQREDAFTIIEQLRADA